MHGSVCVNGASVCLCRGNDSDQEDDGTNPNTKSEVCWGLSESSCNLAKELLSAPQLSFTESDENQLLFAKTESKLDDKEAENTSDNVGINNYIHTHMHSKMEDNTHEL